MNEEGHLIWAPGYCLDRSSEYPQGRYVCRKLLGTGTYGKVIECIDQKHQARAAVKVVRRIPAFRDAALKEIKVLSDLNGLCGTPKMLREFQHEAHICIAFDLLGENLSLIIKNRKIPFAIWEVQEIARQLLEAIDYVHGKGIIHTDVKPDNVRFSGRSSQMQVKLIDFGSAVYATASHPSLIGTPEFRSPEAVLQANWSFPTDIWSLGCIFAEMSLGTQLFTLSAPDSHLEAMRMVTGRPVPPHLLSGAMTPLNAHTAKLLTREITASPSSALGLQRLSRRVKDPALLDLLTEMLMMEPSKRVTGPRALQHPFFQQIQQDTVSQEKGVASQNLNGAEEDSQAVKNGSSSTVENDEQASSLDMTGLTVSDADPSFEGLIQEIDDIGLERSSDAHNHIEAVKDEEKNTIEPTCEEEIRDAKPFSSSTDDRSRNSPDEEEVAPDVNQSSAIASKEALLRQMYEGGDIISKKEHLNQIESVCRDRDSILEMLRDLLPSGCPASECCNRTAVQLGKEMFDTIAEDQRHQKHVMNELRVSLQSKLVCVVSELSGGREMLSTIARDRHHQRNLMNALCVSLQSELVFVASELSGVRSKIAFGFEDEIQKFDSLQSKFDELTVDFTRVRDVLSSMLESERIFKVKILNDFKNEVLYLRPQLGAAMKILFTASESAMATALNSKHHLSKIQILYIKDLANERRLRMQSIRESEEALLAIKSHHAQAVSTIASKVAHLEKEVFSFAVNSSSLVRTLTSSLRCTQQLILDLAFSILGRDLPNHVPETEEAMGYFSKLVECCKNRWVSESMEGAKAMEHIRLETAELKDEILKIQQDSADSSGQQISVEDVRGNLQSAVEWATAELKAMFENSVLKSSPHVRDRQKKELLPGSLLIDKSNAETVLTSEFKEFGSQLLNEFTNLHSHLLSNELNKMMLDANLREKTRMLEISKLTAEVDRLQKSIEIMKSEQNTNTRIMLQREDENRMEISKLNAEVERLKSSIEIMKSEHDINTRVMLEREDENVLEILKLTAEVERLRSNIEIVKSEQATSTMSQSEIVRDLHCQVRDRDMQTADSARRERDVRLQLQLAHEENQRLALEVETAQMDLGKMLEEMDHCKHNIEDSAMQVKILKEEEMRSKEQQSAMEKGLRHLLTATQDELQVAIVSLVEQKRELSEIAVLLEQKQAQLDQKNCLEDVQQKLLTHGSEELKQQLHDARAEIQRMEGLRQELKKAKMELQSTTAKFEKDLSEKEAELRSIRQQAARSKDQLLLSHQELITFIRNTGEEMLHSQRIVSDFQHEYESNEVEKAHNLSIVDKSPELKQQLDDSKAELQRMEGLHKQLHEAKMELQSTISNFRETMSEKEVELQSLRLQAARTRDQLLSSQQGLIDFLRDTGEEMIRSQRTISDFGKSYELSEVEKAHDLNIINNHLILKDTQLAKMKQEIVVLRTQNSASEKGLEERCRDTQGQVQRLEKELKDMQDNANALQEQLLEKEAEAGKIRESASKSKDEHALVEQSLCDRLLEMQEELQASNAEHQLTVQHLTSELDNQKTLATQMISRESHKSELDKLNSKLAIADTDLKDREAEIVRLRSELLRVEKLERFVDLLRKNHTSEMQRLYSELAKLQSMLDSAQETMMPKASHEQQMQAIASEFTKWKQAAAVSITLEQHKLEMKAHRDLLKAEHHLEMSKILTKRKEELDALSKRAVSAEYSVRELEEATAKISQQGEDIKVLQSRLRTAENESKTAKFAVLQSLEELKNLRTHWQAMEGELHEAKSSLTRSLEENQQLRVQLRVAEKERNRLQEALDASINPHILETVLRDKSAAEDEMMRLQQRLSDAAGRIRALSDELSAHRDHTQALQERIAIMVSREDLAVADERTALAEERIVRDSQEIARLKQRNVELAQRVHELSHKVGGASPTPGPPPQQHLAPPAGANAAPNPVTTDMFRLGPRPAKDIPEGSALHARMISCPSPQPMFSASSNPAPQLLERRSPTPGPGPLLDEGSYVRTAIEAFDRKIKGGGGAGDGSFGRGGGGPDGTPGLRSVNGSGHGMETDYEALLDTVARYDRLQQSGRSSVFNNTPYPQ